MTMTPSRTVAICGRCSGLTMVAMMLPPNAGRIWYRMFCQVSPLAVKSPMRRSVQSAVRPVRRALATRGARSRPVVVAPYRTICGSCWRMSVLTSRVYGRARYWPRSSWSARYTVSAPRATTSAARPLRASPDPASTAPTFAPRGAASSRARPSSSRLTSAASPSCCSMKTQTWRAPFTGAPPAISPKDVLLDQLVHEPGDAGLVGLDHAGLALREHDALDLLHARG